MASFTHNIAPHVKAELALADAARKQRNPADEFKHLENAHVLGQESTRWHVTVHWRMLLWGWRQHSMPEIAGQVFRLVGAATKTAIGLIPQGNTGGANVSPFRPMPIPPEHAAKLAQAKQASK